MADSFSAESFSLLVVGILFVTTRVAFRLASVGFKGLWVDDYLMVFATIVYSLETGAAYTVGVWWHGLANNGMTDEQRMMLDPNSQEYHLRVGGSKTQLVGWSLYTLLLWLLKLCVCIFYARLTQGMDWMRWRVRVGFVVVITTYMAVELSILLGCFPFQSNWQIYPNPGNRCQPAVSHINVLVTLVLNVVSDVYLLSIPLPLLYHADVPLRKKISLISLFSGGIFVIAAGCLRCGLILRDPIRGAQAAGSWAVRETFVAVIVANTPIIYQGYRKAIQPRLAKHLSNRSFDRSGNDQASSGHEIELKRLSGNILSPIDWPEHRESGIKCFQETRNANKIFQHPVLPPQIWTSREMKTKINFERQTVQNSFDRSVYPRGVEGLERMQPQDPRNKSESGQQIRSDSSPS